MLQRLLRLRLVEVVLWRRVLHRRDSVTVTARRRGRLQPQRRRLGGLVAHAVAGGEPAAHGVAAKVGGGGLRSVHVVVGTVVGRNKVAGGKGEGIKIVRRISREEGRRVHSTVDFHAVRRLCDVGVPDLGSVWCGWGVVEGGGGRGGSGDEEVENDESWAGGCRCALMRPGLAASTLYRPCRGESASSPARRQINQISDIVFSTVGRFPFDCNAPPVKQTGLRRLPERLFLDPAHPVVPRVSHHDPRHRIPLPVPVARRPHPASAPAAIDRCANLSGPLADQRRAPAPPTCPTLPARGPWFAASHGNHQCTSSIIPRITAFQRLPVSSSPGADEHN